MLSSAVEGSLNTFDLSGKDLMEMYHSKPDKIDYIVSGDFIRHNNFWRPSTLIFSSNTIHYTLKPHPRSFRNFQIDDYYDNAVLPNQPWFRLLDEYHCPNLHLVEDANLDWYLLYVLYEKYLKRNELDWVQFGTTDRAIYHFLLKILPRGCVYFLSPKDKMKLVLQNLTLDEGGGSELNEGNSSEAHNPSTSTLSTLSEDTESESY